MDIPKEVIFQKFFECVARNAEQAVKLLDTETVEETDFYLDFVEEMPTELCNAGYSLQDMGSEVREYVFKLAEAYGSFCLNIR